MEKKDEVSTTVKIIILFVLCVHSSSYNILRSYSGGYLKETWSTSSVLITGEFVKLLLCLSVIVMKNGNESPYRLFSVIKASPKMAIPASIFWVMNQLGFMSLNRVDATTFSTCSQMKIMTTAGFSVLIMGKTLHARQWRALFLLFLGIIMVSSQKYMDNEDTEEQKLEFVGIMMVFAQTILSGFCSVFFERVLKKGGFSLWERNFQICIYSIMFYVPILTFEEESFFDGWTIHSVIITAMVGYGGIIVATAMKYTDSILKTFASSGGIILTTIVTFLYMGEGIDFVTSMGIFCTILSLFNYGDNCNNCNHVEIKEEIECPLIREEKAEAN